MTDESSNVERDADIDVEVIAPDSDDIGLPEDVALDERPLWPKRLIGRCRSTFNTVVAWGGLRHVPLLALVVTYATYFGEMTVNMLRAYQVPAYDFSIPDQGIWLMSRFHDPFSTIAGRNLFGDHTVYIFGLLVPLFWIYPHGAALMVVQSMLIASAAIPVYLLTLHLVKSALLATGFAAAYLLNPVVQQVNLEQVHVEAFEVVFVAWAVYAAVRWRPWLFVLSVGLLLICKEDAAAYAVPLAIWVFFRRDRRAGAAMFVVSAWVAILNIFVAIPEFLGYSTGQPGRIPFGGFSGTLRTIIRTPGVFWSYIVSQGRAWYLWQIGFTSGFAFIRAPEIAALGVLMIIENLLSTQGYQHDISFHYSLPLTPLLVMGSVYAVHRLRSRARQRVATGAVVLCALWSCIIWGVAPFADYKGPGPEPGAAVNQQINALLAKIPPSAPASIYIWWVAHLDHRQYIYFFPNPFQLSYYGNGLGPGPLPIAKKIDYIALPSGNLAADPNLQQVASDIPTILSKYHFRLVAHNAAAVLYKRS